MRIRLSWARETLVSASLGHRLTDKLALATFHARIAVARALDRPLPGPLTARLAPDGHEVVISDPGELSVLHDVIVKREYQPRGYPEVIFDVGANVGFATLFFKRSFPSARILCVEAAPRTYARLQRNVDGLPGVETIHRAAAGADGAVTFYSSVFSITSSLHRQSEADQAVEVRASTLETLMREAGVGHVDLLKVDIEGAEFDFLSSAPLHRVTELIVELHYDLGAGNEAQLRQLLSDFELSFRPLPQQDRWLLYAYRAT